MNAAQLAEAQRLRGQLVAAAAQLRNFCSTSNFRGDRAACGNTADQVDDFLAPASSAPPRGVFARLQAKAAAGDDAAYRNLVTSGSKILVAATGVPFDLRDSTASDLVERIAEDARGAAGEIGVGIGVGAVVAALVAAFFFLGRK